MKINECEITQKQKMKLIDRIIEQYGYGWITWKTYIIVFFILAIEGFHLTLIGNMLIPIQKYYDMSDDHIKLVSGLMFLTVGLGSMSSGYITTKFKRMYVLYFTTFILAVGHLCIGFTSNILIFAIIRCAVGLAIGIVVPISLNLLTEYLPIRYRAIMLSGVWVGFAVGALFNLFIMLLIMPELEQYYYSKTLVTSSSLSFFVVILLLFLKDSPRNLLHNGEYAKALVILEYIYGKELTEFEKEELISEAKGGSNTTIEVSIKEIFNKDYCRVTILLAFNWILLSLIHYGPMLITSKTIEELEKSHDHKSQSANNDIIVDEIIIFLIYFPNSIVAGLICEIPRLGRIKSNIISMAIAIVFLILLIVDSSNYEIYFGFYLFAVSVAFAISTTYSCEVYPTRIRDLALGFLFFCTRMSGFLSQVIYIMFHDWYLWLPYYSSLLFCALNAICIFLLPYETKGRALDGDKENEKLIEAANT
jgi:MFS family permease